jgi:hypothetical protein
MTRGGRGWSFLHAGNRVAQVCHFADGSLREVTHSFSAHGFQVTLHMTVLVTEGGRVYRSLPQGLWPRVTQSAHSITLPHA